MNGNVHNSLSNNEIGDTPRGDGAQEACDVVIPVAVPGALKTRVVEKVGKGNVSPYVRSLIERDLAA